MLSLALQTEIRPFHVCLLKRGSAVPPYVTFKVELLSLVPFASLIYDVIYDDEIRVLTDLAKGKVTVDFCLFVFLLSLL